MSPDYSPLQGCWRKPPPLPNFFQVSNKLLRLLKPLTNSDKSISLKFLHFSDSNERLHKLKCQSHPFEGFYGRESPWSFQEGRMSMEIPSTNAPHPVQKTIILPSCWFTVLLISWHLPNSCGQTTLRVAENQSQGESWACDHRDCHMVLSYDLVTSLSRSISQGIF